MEHIMISFLFSVFSSELASAHQIHQYSEHIARTSILELALFCAPCLTNTLIINTY